jgi:ABC-type spermidine/putrescine transport system permease subunit I
MIPDSNLNNYATILGQKTYLTFLFRSLVMAVSVSLICLIYSYPVAYFVAKRGGRYRLILVILTAAPFFTGIILRVTAMQQILGPIGLVNMGLSQIGIPPIEALMYTSYASAIGLVYLWIPFMVLAIYLSLLNFNFELLEVANVNGARPWRAFWEITWPLNWIGTAIGIALVFIPTFAAAITPRFLGGVNGALFGNILEHQFGATGTWALGSAMGVVLFLICLIFIVIIWRTINLQRSGYTGKLTGE